MSPRPLAHGVGFAVGYALGFTATISVVGLPFWLLAALIGGRP